MVKAQPVDTEIGGKGVRCRDHPGHLGSLVQSGGPTTSTRGERFSPEAKPAAWKLGG